MSKTVGEILSEAGISGNQVLESIGKARIAVNPIVEAMYSGIGVLHQELSRVTEKNAALIARCINNLPNAIDALARLPEEEKTTWTTAAQNGWYLNSETSMHIRVKIKEGPESLDNYMVRHFERDSETIKSNVITASPARAHILRCAFDLHEQGNYIASIPLFFAQADGLCLEYFGVNLFSDFSERNKKIEKQVSEAEGLSFETVMLQLLVAPTQFSARSSNCDVTFKSLAPNRHGILHGVAEHLDYGTKINSLKALSLLAFVSMLFAEQTDELPD